MSVLVTGGAGYIGSHMIKRLLEEGEHVVVLDNLSTGYRDAVLGGEFIHGNFASEDLARELFKKHHIDVVMHFASCSEVAKSIAFSPKYYINNAANILQLLSTMIASGVNNFVFPPLRSTAMRDQAHERRNASGGGHRRGASTVAVAERSVTTISRVRRSLPV